MANKRLQLVGRVFGKLTVLEPAHKNKRGVTHWLCRCECGNTSTPEGSDLVRGTTTSCGCGEAVKVRSIAGEKFGKLTALEMDRAGRGGSSWWTCRCDCGTIVVKRRSHLVTGAVKSCGCDRLKHGTREQAAKVAIFNRYRSSAKKKGLEWGLTHQEFEDVAAKPCAYCGRAPELRSANGRTGLKIEYSGVDRVNNSEGYTPGNVLPCCTWCNKAKNDGSLELFVQNCKAVIDHFGWVIGGASCTD